MRWIFTFLLVVLLGPAAAAQTCTITADVQRGCIPQPVNFSVSLPAGKTAQTYAWDFGDGQSGTSTAPNHIYQTRGTFTVTVTVTFSDGTSCTATLPNPLNIYGNPQGAIAMPADTTLCSNQPLCLRDGSQPGPDLAPITGWTWDLGEGSSSKQQHPCHQFDSSLTYTLTLEVTDQNGCKDFVRQDLNLTILPVLEASFTTQRISASCDSAYYRFDMTTDTSGQDLAKIIWLYGDGTGDTCDLLNGPCSSDTFFTRHNYENYGTYSPMLILESANGCRDTSICQNCVTFNTFDIELTATPDSAICFNGPPLFGYELKPIPNTKETVWNFGDPASGAANEISGTVQWQTAHVYSSPGTFDLRITVILQDPQTGRAVCTKSAFYCGIATLLGPIARINYPPPASRNDTMPAQPFPATSWPNAIDSCRDSLVEYSTLDTVFIPGGNRVEVFCNADTASMTLVNTKICGSDTFLQYEPKLIPTQVLNRDTTIIQETIHTWELGDPLPTVPVFMPGTGINNPQQMHDTDLYSCTVPNWVQFVNNSQKYRGYRAVDDQVLGFKDQCVNPTYGEASDSLTYFWDFGEGTNDTSTAANQDVRARYSTIKEPVHRYDKKGCYSARLTVYDSATGCTSADAVQIVLEDPDAGWADELDTIEHMTFWRQQQLAGLGLDRGLIVTGDNCPGAVQVMNLGETEPQCVPQNYLVVWDSAAAVTADTCGMNGEVVKTIEWNDKTDLEATNYRHEYNTPGWKTLGLVVQNGTCADTMWYHNYKYVYPARPQVVIEPNVTCAGDSAAIRLKYPNQPYIKLVIMKFIYRQDLNDLGYVVRTDTFRYTVSGTDTITSTFNAPTIGKWDGFNFSSLHDTLKFAWDTAGIIAVRTTVISREGCRNSWETEYINGHYVKVSSSDTTVCSGTTIDFTPTVQYYTYKDDRLALNPTLFWRDPYGMRPDTPAIPEQLRWDLDGDSIPDDSSYYPSWTYTQPGTYTVRLWTKDSAGCGWQEHVLENFIQVVDLNASFTVDSPGAFRVCAPHFFTFTDSSYIGGTASSDSVVTWKWDFGDSTAQVVRTDTSGRHVSHVYLHNGTFTVTLTVELSNGCVDSTTRQIEIFGPTPRYEFIDTTTGCAPFTVTVRDFSTNTSTLEYLLGDGRTYTPAPGEEFLTFTYTEPGTYCIRVVGTDSIRDVNDSVLYCSDIFPFDTCELQVTVLPRDPLSFNMPSVVCLPQATATIRNTSDTSYTHFYISFGDGDSSDNSIGHFNHRYDSVGTYPITFWGTGANCPDTITQYIEVTDILAAFTIDSLRSDTPTFWFSNTSQGGSRWQWTFGDGTTQSTEEREDISHRFPAPGTYTVCLTAWNDADCEDSTCKEVTVVTEIKIPNVFTPNGDGANDRFQIPVVGEEYYHLRIFNRWGELLFESTDKDDTWTGQIRNTGTEVPEGSYFFLFDYQLIGTQRKQVQGSITLLRG